MKDPDAKKKEWLQYHLQASGGFVGLPNRLIDSKAFAALTTGASGAARPIAAARWRTASPT